MKYLPHKLKSWVWSPEPIYQRNGGLYLSSQCCGGRNRWILGLHCPASLPYLERIRDKKRPWPKTQARTSRTHMKLATVLGSGMELFSSIRYEFHIPFLMLFSEYGWQPPRWAADLGGAGSEVLPDSVRTPDLSCDVQFGIISLRFPELLQIIGWFGSHLHEI